MTLDDVLAVLDRLDDGGVPWCLAGGWAVDALAGEQTRPHADVDLIVPAADLPSVERLLADIGYARTDESELPAFLILGDRAERQVDLYLVSLDESTGDAWQEFGDGKWDVFPASDLFGAGRLAGRDVRCLGAHALFRQFLGYRWTEKTRHDLRLLHHHGGTPLPPDMV